MRPNEVHNKKQQLILSAYFSIISSKIIIFAFYLRNPYRFTQNLKTMINIRKLEAELWESADLLRAGSKLTSQQYCMPVLGLLFLRYAYGRFKKVEAEILKDRPIRNGRVMPVEASDFAEKSALYLPEEAQYSYLVNLPENIPAALITYQKDG